MFPRKYIPPRGAFRDNSPIDMAHTKHTNQHLEINESGKYNAAYVSPMGRFFRKYQAFTLHLNIII